MNFEIWYFLVGWNLKVFRFLKGLDGRFFYLRFESFNKENWNIIYDSWIEGNRGFFVKFFVRFFKSNLGRKWER